MAVRHPSSEKPDHHMPAKYGNVLRLKPGIDNRLSIQLPVFSFIQIIR